MLGVIYFIAMVFTAFLGEEGNATAAIFLFCVSDIFDSKRASFIILFSVCTTTIIKFAYNGYELLYLINIIILYIGAQGINKYLKKYNKIDRGKNNARGESDIN